MIKGAFVISIFASTLSMGSAWADETSPRRSYQIQVCHHSTASVVKNSLRRDSINIDDFCVCMANKVVERITQPEDHSYALAYHEVNVVAERKIRYEQPVQEIFGEFSIRAKGYEGDFGISIKDLLSHTKHMKADVSSCSVNKAQNSG